MPEKLPGLIILWFLVLVLFDPAKSAEPPIKLGNFATIFKNISDDFLVAIGFLFSKYSIFAFSIIFLNDLKLFKFE